MIYLRHVERSRPQQTRQEQERTFEPPVFLTPLRDVKQVEGSRAHFEAKVHPVGDSTMRVRLTFQKGQKRLVKPLKKEEKKNAGKFKKISM